jgi:hypothetical protein
VGEETISGQETQLPHGGGGQCVQQITGQMHINRPNFTMVLPTKFVI